MRISESKEKTLEKIKEIRKRIITFLLLTLAFSSIFIQGVFTPLTIDTGVTEYFVDESGAALAVVSVLVAYVFWKKRSQLNSTHLLII